MSKSRILTRTTCNGHSFPVSLVLTMTPGKIIVYALCFGSLGSVAKSSGRQRRELRFPKGASVVVAVALASFLPKGPADGLAHLLEFDLGFPFPETFSIRKKQTFFEVWENGDAMKLRERYKSKRRPGKARRTERSSKEKQRKELLQKLQGALTWIGLDGFACVSKFRCELRGTSPQDSLLEQLLVSLFKTDSEDVEDCGKHRASCQVSLLQIFMHSEQLSSSLLM